MTTPVAHPDQSPVESALLDVHATLAELLAAADEQYAAVAAHDAVRLENVTWQQERLCARLERAEHHRIELLGNAPLQVVVQDLPPEQAVRATTLSVSIGESVLELQRRNTQTAGLLERSIELAAQTVQFLQRLVSVQNPIYGARGAGIAGQSLLVDGRA